MVCGRCHESIARDAVSVHNIDVVSLAYLHVCKRHTTVTVYSTHILTCCSPFTAEGTPTERLYLCWVSSTRMWKNCECNIYSHGSVCPYKVFSYKKLRLSLGLTLGKSQDLMHNFGFVDGNCSDKWIYYLVLWLATATQEWNREGT